MFFYSKKLMREAGIDDATIEGLPAAVLAGDITMDDLSGLAQQVVDSTGAEYGILHRPSVGPDYIMVFNSYGNSFLDQESGNLLLEPEILEAAFGWFERNVQNGVTPANNTAMEWGDIRAAFFQNDNAAFWMYGIWDLGSNAFSTYGVSDVAEEFDKDWGWVAAPPAEKGGSPSSLTHPIIYAVAAGHCASGFSRPIARLRFRCRSKHRPCGNHDPSRDQKRPARRSAVSGSMAACPCDRDARVHQVHAEQPAVR